MVTRMFFRLLHKRTGIPTAGIQVWCGFPELCSMGAVESAFCINSVACHSYVLCEAWEGGTWQSFLPLFGHNTVSRELSCGANVQSVCFSSRVGLGRLFLTQIVTMVWLTSRPPQGAGAERKVMCSELLRRGETKRQRVQLLGTVLLPAHRVTPLLLRVLPSQVFCNW